VGPGLYPPIARLDAAQADQPGRAEYRCFHHQHQGGAAGDRAHLGIVGVEERQRLGKRARLRKREWSHDVASCGDLASRSEVASCGALTMVLPLNVIDPANW